MGKFSQSIKDILEGRMAVSHLDILDESHMHSRRTAENPETHFKVVVVSDDFEGLSRIQRHQKVYGLLSRLFEEGLHSLTQSTYTQTEWQNQPKVQDSPKCGHGK